MIAIAPSYAKGMPADVVTQSLDRVTALAQIVESYYIDGGDDESHAVPIDYKSLQLILAMIGEHATVAKEAMRGVKLCDCV